MKKFTILMSLISFCYADPQYNPKDKAIFEQTHVCNSCDLTSVGGFIQSAPLPNYMNSILTGSNLSYLKFTQF